MKNDFPPPWLLAIGYFRFALSALWEMVRGCWKIYDEEKG